LFIDDVGVVGDVTGVKVIQGVKVEVIVVALEDCLS